MNTYICDACGSVITDPYKVKMKEFYIGCEFDYGTVFPRHSTRKQKIHLCDGCYRNLKNLVKETRK